MYAILNGKGGLTGSGQHVYSLAFVLMVCCFCISQLTVEEKWRTTSSVSWLVEGLLDIKTLCLTCLLLLCTTHVSRDAGYCLLYPCTPCCPLQNDQNMPYLVAIVDYTHVRSATASFEDLVTLHSRTLQQLFGRGSATASIGHGNSWPGARTPLVQGVCCGKNRQRKLRMSRQYLLPYQRVYTPPTLRGLIGSKSYFVETSTPILQIKNPGKLGMLSVFNFLISEPHTGQADYVPSTSFQLSTRVQHGKKRVNMFEREGKQQQQEEVLHKKGRAKRSRKMCGRWS